jgi:hypothetical protein
MSHVDGRTDFPGSTGAFLVVLFALISVVGCDTLEEMVEDCVLEVTSGHAAYLSLEPGQEWRYDLVDIQRDIFGDWYEEAVRGELSWEVMTVECAPDGLSIGLRETVRGEKTATRITGWCCVSDPDTVVTKSDVSVIRYLDASVRDEYLVIPGYTQYPGALHGTHRLPVARWLRSSDTPSPVEDHEFLFAGFGAQGTSRIVMARDTGLLEWEYTSGGNRPTNWSVLRALRMIE